MPSLWGLVYKKIFLSAVHYRVIAIFFTLTYSMVFEASHLFKRMTLSTKGFQIIRLLVMSHQKHTKMIKLNFKTRQTERLISTRDQSCPSLLISASEVPCSSSEWLIRIS
jgi:hypothetical protein